MAEGGDSVAGLPEPGGGGPVVLDGMRLLRLCSVFEPAALSQRSADYDAIGGMQNHTAELSRQLDRMGAVQLVLTSRPNPARPAAPGSAGGGRWCGPEWTPGWPAGAGAAGRPAGSGRHPG
jgi:hypothetical protein